LEKIGYRVFAHAPPVLWNSLPLTITTSSSLAIFKKRLKTFLFRKLLICWNSAGQLEKSGILEKSGTHGKVRLMWKNAAHFENFGTLGKMRHTLKRAAHLEKCGTLEKVRNT